ncbi:MAG TPA: aminotransferase class I/II-fold pyridoxal phosphate-dependent enzyme [Longimicrobiales bacterium]
MSSFRPFAMERWQSTYENRVQYNLSESGVHPLAMRELLDMAGHTDIGDTLLGYGQSNGSDTLRARIAALYPNCSDACVVATNGSAEAKFIALWELAQPGDEIAIVVPAYMQTYGLAQNFGATVREIWLHEAAGWQPDPDEIRSAITDRTRVVIVTNPNNPTGAILGRDARRAIIESAARVGAWIIADEVYSGAEVTAPETPSFFAEYDRVVATGSLSKAYGLPGLRIGWAVAPAELAARLWARKDYLTISPGELTDRIATIALDPAVRPRVLQRTRSFLHAGLAILEPWLRDSGIFTYTPPQAGAIVYARYDLPMNSSELAERLRADHSVLIVPGDHFAMDGYVRIGFGLPDAALQQALSGFSKCLVSLTQIAAESIR